MDQSSSLSPRSIVDPLYGLKVAGTEKEIDIALLNSIDRSPLPSFNEQETPGFSPEDVENAWALNSYARVRYPLLGQGFIGVSTGEKRLIASSNSDPSVDRSDSVNDILSFDSLIPLGDIWTINSYSSTSYTSDSVDSLVGNNSFLSLSRSPDIGWGGSFSGYRISQDYRNELGFATQSGNFGGNGALSYANAFSESSFSKASLFASYHEEYTGNQNIMLSASEQLTLNGIHRLNLEVAPIQRRYKNYELLTYFADAEFSSRPSSNLSYSVSMNARSEIDFDQLLPATVYQPEASVSLRPNQRLRIDSSFNQIFYQVEEQEQSTASNIYNRISWQLTREWGLRLIEQSSFFSEKEAASHNGSILFTWLQSPGTAAYLGNTWTIEEGELSEIVLFAKYTHLFWY